MLRRFRGVAAMACLSVVFWCYGAKAAEVARAPWEARFMEAPPSEVLSAARALPVPPDASVQLLFEERIHTFSADGSARSRYRRVYRVLTAAGVEGWSRTQASWSPWHQDQTLVRARVIGPNGRAHLLDPKTFEISGGGSDDDDVYTDRRLLRAPLPAVAVGSIVEEELVDASRPLLPGTGQSDRWYVGGYVPIVKSRLLIEAPATLGLRVVPHGIAVSGVQKDGERTRFEIEVGPLPGRSEIEDDLPDDAAPIPFIAYGTTTSWADLASRYAELVERQLTGADVAALARDIKVDRARPEAAIAQAVASLHREIRYTGVEFGDAAIVPRSPGEVLQRRYGDCKDKAALLVAVLRRLGLKAHVALLRAGRGPDVEQDLPTLDAFNHAIVHVQLPSKASLWIDATAAYSPVGEVPGSVQGRRALVAAPGTTALKTIPFEDASRNFVREVRAIAIDEDGKSRVVERTEAHGAAGRYYRWEYNSTERKQLEEHLRKYVGDAYDGAKLDKLEHGDPTDTSKPFVLELHTSGAEVAAIDDEGASVILRAGSAVERLPAELRPTKEEPNAEATPKKPRQGDFVIREPFVHEIRYEITAPHGYVPQSPPEPAQWSIGPGTLKSTFSIEGTRIIAVHRFEWSTRRLGPAEYEATRKQARAFLTSNAPVAKFQHEGAKALASGNVRQALAIHRRLEAEHPDEPKHAMHLAAALLAAGLGDAARAEARRATTLSPPRAAPYRALGWVLEHDLVGRYMGSGADLAGAQAAYRKALEIDAEDVDAMAALASLLVRDATGDDSYPKEHLAEVDRLYAALEKKDVEGRRLDHLIVRFRRGQYDDVIKEAAKVAASNDRDGLVVAAVAIKRGIAAAISEAATRVSDPGNRAEVVRIAAAEMLRERNYPAASALFQEAARSHKNGAALRLLAGRLAHTKRRESVKLDLTKAEGMAKHAFALVFTARRGDKPPRETLAKLFAPELKDEIARDWGSESMHRALKRNPVTSGFSPEVLADMIVANDVYVDGPAAIGQRVRFPAADGAAQQQLFMSVRPEGPRLIAFGPGAAAVGREALRHAKASRWEAARVWIDWGVEGESLGTADDPLSGSAVARIWTKGSPDNDRDVVVTAAAMLAATANDGIDDWQPALEGCASDESPEPRRSLCRLTLGEAMFRVGRADRALELAVKLGARFPASQRVEWLRLVSLRKLGKSDDLLVRIKQGLATKPDDPVLLRAHAEELMARGDLKSSVAVYQKLANSPHRVSTHFNQMAWLSLFMGDNSEGPVSTARRAVELSNGRDLAALHTLATLLAERDRPEEAHDRLIEIVNARPADTLAPHDQYVLGRIAESYGFADLAKRAYEAVTPETESFAANVSTFVLAQKRLARLRAAGDSAAGTAAPKAPPPTRKQAGGVNAAPR